MIATLNVFWAQKAGNAPNEYEDAFYPASHGTWPGKTFRAAISDGASESLLSGQWSNILVKSFARSKAPEITPEQHLNKAYEAWGYWRENYLQQREKKGRPIQWYEEHGLRAGAFSTLLVLLLIEDTQQDKGKWKAVALGDSCLFQVGADGLQCSFPMGSSEDFNNQPPLVPSIPAKCNSILQHFNAYEGHWSTDDRFYLMTDALSCWFLKELELGRRPWLSIDRFDSPTKDAVFSKWIDDLRENNQIRNDDVTLIRITLSSPREVL